MDDGACAGNRVRRLRISKLTAGGKLQSTWEYNMPLCWLIQPTIRLNKLNRCRSSATAWWPWAFPVSEDAELQRLRMDDELWANFSRWVKKLFRSCERLDGRKKCTASSHFGKPGKVGWGGAEAHAQSGIRNLQVPGARCLSSRTFCSSDSNHLGWRWHREHPARVGC